MRQYGRGIAKTGTRDFEILAASGREWLLISTTFLAVLLLNVSAVNHSIGALLMGYLCFFSLSSPFSALLALSASQVVADPVGLPLTQAQCLFLGWGFHFLFRRRKNDYRALRILLLWTLPYIVAAKCFNLIKWGAVPSIDNFDLAVMLGVMAAWYIGQLRDRFLLAFLCIILGASTSTLSFWLGVSGVTMEGVTLLKGGPDVEAIGVGRGDGNFSGVSISLAAISILAWGTLIKVRYQGFKVFTKINSYLCIGFFLISIPAVFATMSRGAVLTFSLGVGFVLFSALNLNSVARNRIVISGIAACIFGIISFNSDDGLMRRYSESMLNLSEDQIQDSVMMSRTGTWEAALEEILNSPFIGTTPETRVSLDVYGYDYCSHNVWLDVGRGTGILGMLWFTAFFFYPVWVLFKSLTKARAFLLCSSFVVLFCVFFNLSVVNLKVFYFLWVLAVAAAATGDTSRKYTLRRI
jgi:hypothetical protein